MSMIVIMPGGFHPFHAGHYALYQSAKKAFPNADLYVAATNDMSERPFPFALKEKLAKLAGVEPGHFVQVKNPFKSEEITQNYDPNSDVLLFVRSEKDRNEHPKPGGTKKDGTPSYFQPWTGKDVKPFGQQAYMAYLPTVEFGPGITSATQIRKAWPTLNDKRKTALVMSLYPVAQKNPKIAQNVVGMFDQVMGGQVTESSMLDEGLGDYITKKIDDFLDIPKIPSQQVSRLMKSAPANLPDDVAEKLVAKFMETEKAKRLAQHAAEANKTTVEKIIPYLTFFADKFVEGWKRIPQRDRDNALKNLVYNIGRFFLFILEALIKGAAKKESVEEERIQEIQRTASDKEGISTKGLSFDKKTLSQIKMLPGSNRFGYIAGGNRSVNLNADYIIDLFDVKHPKDGLRKAGFLALRSAPWFPMKNSYQVTNVGLDDEYRGQGLGQNLYGVAMKLLGMTIVADESQTPQARSSWLRLSQIPGVSINGYTSLFADDWDNQDNRSEIYDESAKRLISALVRAGGQEIGESSPFVYVSFPVGVNADKTELQSIQKGISIYSARHPEDGGTSNGLYARWVGAVKEQGMAEEKSDAIARTANDLTNPPKVMQHRAKRDIDREETHRNAQLGKDDLDSEEDLELQQLMRKAQQHYPSMPGKQQAFIKFVQRALKHSEEEDIQQDKEIEQLKSELNKIQQDHKKIMKVSENKDYLEEK